MFDTLGSSVQAVQNLELDSPVWFLVTKGDLKQAERLIESGEKFPAQIQIKDNEKKNSSVRHVNLLHMIALLGEKRNPKDQVSFAEFLIDRNVIEVNALDSEGYTALYYAILHNCYYLAVLLLENGARLEGSEWEEIPALCLGAWVDPNRFVPMLLRYNAPVGLAGGNLGRTALHWIMCLDKFGKRELRIIDAVIKRGESPNAQDVKMESPLHLAVRDDFNNNFDLVKMLLEHGADVDLRNEHGQTALFLAAFNSNAQVVELLLKYGAKVNARSNNNSTALHVACCYHRAENMRVLIKYGANVTIRNDHGKTPFSLMIFDIINEPAYRVMIEEFGKLHTKKRNVCKEDLEIIKKHKELVAWCKEIIPRPNPPQKFKNFLIWTTLFSIFVIHIYNGFQNY